MSAPTLEQRRDYAQRSLNLSSGDMTEDELLQRIWILATDVLAFAEAWRASELRATPPGDER